MQNVLEVKIHEDFFLTLFQKTYTPYSLLREFISDSYEADAEKVFVNVLGDGTIVIWDEGKHAGMSMEDVEAFVTVGTPRRRLQAYSEHYKRPISGRYGIGRFSFLRLYRRLDVETEREGARFAFSITTELLRELAKGGRPKVAARRLKPTNVNGTKFTFLEPETQSNRPTPADVRRFVESNFATLLVKPIGPFEVFVNGVKVCPKRLPRDAQVYNINEKVEAVSVKGRVGESAVTGYIAVSQSKLPAEIRGVQLTVSGSPIGGRMSLGEILGDRTTDARFPFERITGVVEAPFLTPSPSREKVDSSDKSYAKFKDALLKAVKTIVAEAEAREDAAVEDVKGKAMLEVQRLLESTIKNMPELWSMGGLVGADAAGEGDMQFPLEVVKPQTPRPETPGSAANPSTENPAKGERGEAAEKPHQVIRVYSSREVGKGSVKKVREVKAAGACICYDKVAGTMALSLVIPKNRKVVINEAHPCFERRLKNVKLLRNYICRLAIDGMAKILEEEGVVADASVVQGKLLNEVEVLTGEPVS